MTLQDNLSKGMSELASRALTKPRRNRLLAFLIASLSEPLNPKRWCFIVGCYNSGTTLLERLLGLHPYISALDEGAFRTAQLVTPEELGWPRMWHQVLEEVQLGPTDQRMDAEALKRDWAIFFDRRKPVLLEKSISNSARIRWFDRHFEDAHFIHIVRNGYAVAEGIRRKTAERQHKWTLPEDHQPMYPIEMCAKEWVVSNRIIEEDATGVSNLKKLHYEDLCRAPYDSVMALLSFLDLDLSKEESDQFAEGLQIATQDVRNMNEGSIARLSPADVKAIESVASDDLVRQGYHLLSQQRDSEMT